MSAPAPAAALSGYERLRCHFDYELFASPATGWCARRYIDEGGKRVKVVGTGLPAADRSLTVDLFGAWENTNRGLQFQVAYSQIPEPDSQQGVVAYIRALGCGIGKVLAQRIYSQFGPKTWDVLQTDPWRLSEVHGVSRKKVDALVAALERNKELTALTELLCRYGVDLSSRQMLGLTKKYADPIAVLQEDPYQVIGLEGINFQTMDTLGLKLGIALDDPRRLLAFIPTYLGSIAAQGHVCYPAAPVPAGPNGQGFAGLVAEISQALGVSGKAVLDGIRAAQKKGLVKVSGGLVYTDRNYAQEVSIADDLWRLQSVKATAIRGIDRFISEYETANFTLAPEQRAAVRAVFSGAVTIITGGPGTGKSTVTKAILYCHEQVYGASSQPVLLAPTGKAARRLADVTGCQAQTVHSAVGYRGEEFGELMTSEGMLEGDLFIVDESSMLDQAIASVLFSKIPTGAKLVLVGDPDQLPSVGCGNVLADMIASKVIPTVKLEVIFRQSGSGSSPIVANAKKIQTGDPDLEFCQSFKFLEAETEAEAFKTACSMYVRCVRAYGIDNVVLLNPQRRNTALSVPELNKKLQAVLHEDYPDCLPYSSEKGISLQVKSTVFKVGDKVMQLKNTASARNGDTGYIVDIHRQPDPNDMEKWSYIVEIDFSGGQGHHLMYDAEAMQDVDLAFASTVHKAQGDEYKVVLAVVSSAHPTMLKRQVVYTAVTRAKANVAIIGDRRALIRAVENGIPDKRFTRLAGRLKERECNSKKKR